MNCEMIIPQVIQNRIAANSTDIRVLFTDEGELWTVRCVNASTDQIIIRTGENDITVNLTDGQWVLIFSKVCGGVAMSYPYQVALPLSAQPSLSGGVIGSFRNSLGQVVINIEQPMPTGYNYLHAHYRVRGTQTWIGSAKIPSTGNYQLVGVMPDVEYEVRLRASKNKWIDPAPYFWGTEWEYLFIKTVK